MGKRYKNNLKKTKKNKKNVKGIRKYFHFIFLILTYFRLKRDDLKKKR
jgi:hypothetical protein